MEVYRYKRTSEGASKHLVFCWIQASRLPVEGWMECVCGVKLGDPSGRHPRGMFWFDSAEPTGGSRALTSTTHQSNVLTFSLSWCRLHLYSIWCCQFSYMMCVLCRLNAHMLHSCTWGSLYSRSGRLKWLLPDVFVPRDGELKYFMPVITAQCVVWTYNSHLNDGWFAGFLH